MRGANSKKVRKVTRLSRVVFGLLALIKQNTRTGPNDPRP